MSRKNKLESDQNAPIFAKADVFKDLMIRPGRGRGDVPLMQSHLKLIIVPSFQSKKTSNQNETDECKDECKIEILTLYPKENRQQTSFNEEEWGEEEWGEEEQECEEGMD